MTGRGTLKALIGVCGIGGGHTTRQIETALELQKRGHKVMILAYGAAVNRLRESLPNITVLECYVPWIACNANGILLFKSLWLSGLKLIPGLLLDMRILYLCARYSPDVCISDYEPLTARIAYWLKVPLITVDQQSKFLGYNIPPVGMLNREEERARLALFFPSAQKRLSLSFYSIREPRDPAYDVEIIPPFVSRSLNQNSSKQIGHTLVYLSHYGDHSSVDIESLMLTLEMFPTRRFTVVDSLQRKPTCPSNVRLVPLGKSSFSELLSMADSVITTAGFTIITECIELNTPLMVIPLATYDQYVCATEVQRLGIGIGLEKTRCPTIRELEYFLSNLDSWGGFYENTSSILHPSPYSLKYVCDQIESVAFKPNESDIQ